MDLKLDFLQKMIEEAIGEKELLEFSAFPSSQESEDLEKDFSQADDSVGRLIDRNKKLEAEVQRLKDEIEQLKKSENEKVSVEPIEENLFRIKKTRLKEIVIEEMKKAKDQGLI